VKQFSFRHKVLLLAVALVMAIQLVALFPVLNAIKADVDQRARQHVELAGVLFDENMRNRTDNMLTTAKVLVADYGFVSAVAGGDHPTIQGACKIARRVGATVAVLPGPRRQRHGELDRRRHVAAARHSSRSVGVAYLGACLTRP
jgi:hypothetical protein